MAFLGTLFDATFDGIQAAKRKIELRALDVRDLAEDLRKDPTRTVAKARDQAGATASRVWKDVKRDPVGAVKQSFSTSLTTTAHEQQYIDHMQWRPIGAGQRPVGAQKSMPLVYQEHMKSLEDPCPRCLALASNLELRLSYLRKGAEDEENTCWVCRMFWEGIESQRQSIEEEVGQVLESEEMAYFAGMWPGFELYVGRILPDSDQVPGVILEFYTNGFRIPGMWPPVMERRHVYSDPMSEQSMKDVESWLRGCDRNHLMCRSTLSRDPPLPARVLHVDGSVEPPLVRLFETDGLRGRYIALSHCWGTSRLPKTMSATYSQHTSQIEWPSLTKTFRDSVRMTIALNIQYLWIDSLCIIQDSQADWLAESTKMDTIYEQAYLVLAATAMDDGAVGLFRDRAGFTAVELTAHDTPPGERLSADGSVIPQTFFVRYFSSDHAIFVQRHVDPTFSSLESRLPLWTRAWAFQERVLATRVLHYTTSELIWECRTEVTCECRQIEEPSPGGLKYLYHESMRAGHGLLGDGRALWFNTLAEYTSRHLTYHTDRLIALSGCARRLEHSFLGKYHAGLWDRVFLASLLWRRRDDEYPPPRSAVYIAPTWSWASVEGTIINSPEKTQAADMSSWVRPGDFGRPHWHSVEDIQCDLATDDPFGRVTGGHFKVRTRLVLARFETVAHQKHVIECCQLGGDSTETFEEQPREDDELNEPANDDADMSRHAVDRTANIADRDDRLGDGSTSKPVSNVSAELDDENVKSHDSTVARTSPSSSSSLSPTHHADDEVQMSPEIEESSDLYSASGSHHATVSSNFNSNSNANSDSSPNSQSESESAFRPGPSTNPHPNDNDNGTELPTNSRSHSHSRSSSSSNARRESDQSENEPLPSTTSPNLRRDFLPDVDLTSSVPDGALVMCMPFLAWESGRIWALVLRPVVADGQDESSRGKGSGETVVEKVTATLKNKKTTTTATTTTTKNDVSRSGSTGMSSSSGGSGGRSTNTTTNTTTTTPPARNGLFDRYLRRFMPLAGIDDFPRTYQRLGVLEIDRSWLEGWFYEQITVF